MKNNTSTTNVPSTREESLNMIIQEFLDSNNNQIWLALYPYEISVLENKYKEIVIRKAGYFPANKLSIFAVSKVHNQVKTSI